MKVRERSAGIVPVRRVASGWLLLGLRCYRNWDFPKGRVEEGETQLEAALREAQEEADLTDLRLEWGEHAFCETAPYGKGKVARYYLARTEQREIVLPPNPELGRPEHHEGRWFRWEEAAEVFPPRLKPILAWVREELG